MFGLLNINKPSGITSRRVVDRVARLVKPLKAGHAGTLDPLASGVLVVCVGQATRLIEYVQRMPKRYRATFLLGRSSPTEDVEGEVSELAGAPEPSRAQIEQAAQGMLGQLAQRPPAFSAIKVAGRRSYDLARAGQAVELEPRTITVYGIDLIAYRYPELELDIRCGSGTYVRTLGRELAERLGSCAVMSLERTEPSARSAWPSRSNSTSSRPRICRSGCSPRCGPWKICRFRLAPLRYFPDGRARS